jgi:hypothetical protein
VARGAGSGCSAKAGAKPSGYGMVVTDRDLCTTGPYGARAADLSRPRTEPRRMRSHGRTAAQQCHAGDADAVSTVCSAGNAVAFVERSEMAEGAPLMAVRSMAWGRREQESPSREEERRIRGSQAEPRKTPRGSNSKAQGKRSATLGVGSPRSPSPEGASQNGIHTTMPLSKMNSEGSSRNMVSTMMNGMFGIEHQGECEIACETPSGSGEMGVAHPGLRFAYPGLWSLTPLGSETSA